MNEKFDNIVRQRIYQRVPLAQIGEAGIAEFYVAGNSLNKQPPNDIDIFPVGNPFTKEQARKLGFVVSETRNAITVKVNLDYVVNHQTADGENEINIGGRTVTVQLCNYHHENLEKLVNSFDFAHIQIGAKVEATGIDVYYTKAYEDSKLCQSTEYIGSEYPLSSLLRAFKYAKRGDFAGNSHIFSVLKVLTDIVDRGFDDFNDFKDQMDAIDLGLVPENENEMKEAGFSWQTADVLDKLMNFLILGKKAICKDAGIAYKYAQVLGGRFEKGEEVISKNAELSLQYAKNIIKGRFEKGEEVIGKSAEFSLVYASVIKERFEKGEEAIAGNGSYSLFNYWNFIKKDNTQRLPENLHNMMIALGMENDYHAKLYLANFMDKAA